MKKVILGVGMLFCGIMSFLGTVFYAQFCSYMDFGQGFLVFSLFFSVMLIIIGLIIGFFGAFSNRE